MKIWEVDPLERPECKAVMTEKIPDGILVYLIGTWLYPLVQLLSLDLFRTDLCCLYFA